LKGLPPTLLGGGVGVQVENWRKTGRFFPPVKKVCKAYGPL